MKELAQGNASDEDEDVDVDYSDDDAEIQLSDDDDDEEVEQDMSEQPGEDDDEEEFFSGEDLQDVDEGSGFGSDDGGKKKAKGKFDADDNAFASYEDFAELLEEGVRQDEEDRKRNKFLKKRSYGQSTMRGGQRGRGRGGFKRARR